MLKSLKPKKSEFTPQTLGNHLRKRRLDLGMTQRDVAKCLDVTNVTVLNWELGLTVPRAHHVPPLIRFLGYDPAPPLCATLSEQLAEKRRMFGWTKKDAAQNFGVDPGTWCDWERGGTVMLITHRALIARFLGLSKAELYAAMKKRWKESHGKATWG